MDLTLVVVTTKALTLTFGGILTWLSYRAFIRTGAPALRALAVGIGLVTIGALVGGVVHQVLGLSVLAGVAVQGAFSAAGFAVLTYSLYADGPTDPVSPRSNSRNLG
ncbi:MAG: hypothetical protein V5A44_00965 [Haloarculaceae archaeon]